jgi:uncharacterized protein with HEPN domain
MTRRDPRIFLHDMLDSSRQAVGLMQGRTRADLDSDPLLGLAMTRLIAIVGEAAARVPDEVRARLPAIPWRRIVGMRNRLIHAYRAVEADIVWDTLTADLPALIAELEHALADDETRPHTGDAP